MEDIRRNYVKSGDGQFYLEEKNNATGVVRYFDGVRYTDTVARMIVKVSASSVPLDRKEALDMAGKAKAKKPAGGEARKTVTAKKQIDESSK